MTDDEDTAKMRKRGRSQANDPGTSSVRRRAAVPVLSDEPDEITEPVDLLERELSESEIDVVRRSKRNSDDPATYADVVKLTERQISREKSDQATNREIKKLLGRLETAEQLDARLRKVERLIGLGKKLAAALAGVVLSSSGYVIKTIQARSELQGETTIRLQHIEESVRRLEEHDYRSRSYDPSPAERPWPVPPLPTTTTKDKP